MTEQLNQTNQKKASSLPQNQSKKSSQNRRKRNRSEFSTNNQSQKPFYQKKNKDEFDLFRFHWCYGKGDIPEDMELAATSEKRLVRSGSTIDHAKGTLRSDIREIGGNATMNLSIERGETRPNDWGQGYKAAIYYATSNPALVLPKQMPQKEKEERISKFLLLSAEFKDKPKDKENNFDLRPLLNIFITAIIIFLVYSYFR